MSNNSNSIGSYNFLNDYNEDEAIAKAIHESLGRVNNDNNNENSNNTKSIKSELNIGSNEDELEQEYVDINDVDYVRINVTGDGSCFYRALFVAAYMYPIDREIIRFQLKPEFTGVTSMLIPVLQAFGYTGTERLNEEDSVTFMRKQLSKGILGTHPDPEINTICDTAITDFYNITTAALCESYSSGDFANEKSILANRRIGSSFKDIVEGENAVIAAFFTTTPAAKLTLHNFRELVASKIVDKTTYASQLDIGIIDRLLERKNIKNMRTTLNRFNKNQTFPIIENGNPVLIVDNTDEIHYKALVPKVEYHLWQGTTFNKGRTTIEHHVNREQRPTIIDKKTGKKVKSKHRGKPIVFSKRTYNYRVTHRLTGGRTTLKRRGRK